MLSLCHAEVTLYARCRHLVRQPQLTCLANNDTPLDMTNCSINFNDLLKISLRMCVCVHYRVRNKNKDKEKHGKLVHF